MGIGSNALFCRKCMQSLPENKFNAAGIFCADDFEPLLETGETTRPSKKRMSLYHLKEVNNPGEACYRDLFEEIIGLNGRLISTPDEAEQSRLIVAASGKAIRAERGAIFIRQGEDPQNLVLAAAENLTHREISAPGFAAPMDLVHETFLGGTAKIVNTDSHIPADFLTGEHALSCICLPIVIRGHTIGVMYQDRKLHRGSFEEYHLKVLQYFTYQAALIRGNHLKEGYSNHREFQRNFACTDFIGASAGMKGIFGEIATVAVTDATVLILGETGVGKELVAKYVHLQSARKDLPFIMVNCNALPETLISSELFGHEKGAFTGAISRQIGRFEIGPWRNPLSRRNRGHADRGSDQAAQGIADQRIRTRRWKRNSTLRLSPSGCNEPKP